MAQVKHEGLEIRKGRNGLKWYWHISRRGRIVADGAQGYTRRADCVRAARAILRWLKTSRITIFDQQ